VKQSPSHSSERSDNANFCLSKIIFAKAKLAAKLHSKDKKFSFSDKNFAQMKIK